MKVYKIYFFIAITSLFIFTSCEYKDNTKHRLQWWIDELECSMNSKCGEINIPIAVIDTGVDFSHPDIKDAKLIEFVLPNIKEEDEYKNLHHGTEVVGIICAYPSTDDGVLGINPLARIVSIVATNDDKSIKVENMIAAIDYAIKQDVKIINISCGVKNDYRELHEKIVQAYDKGIIIVAASGNVNSESILYPARYNEVIAVSSYDKKIKPLYIYANDDSTKKIIYLPGENLVTTDWKESDDFDYYISVSGTSFSASIMSGIISNIIQKNSTIKNTDIYKHLEKFYSKMITEDNIYEVYSID